MINRFWNSRNPLQGESKRVLCVCSAGIARSPTTANVLHREFGYNTRAAGVDRGCGLIIVDEVLVHWASEIVVMETYHEDIINNMLSDNHQKTAVNLDIPDCYEYMNEDLQNMILQNYLERNETKE